MKKQSLFPALFLALAMALVLLPTTALADDPPTSGTCGENLTWTLENGTLTISGSGKMYDYYGSAPWDDSSYYITAVEIGDGITYIGVNAFLNCNNLTDVIIPDSVTSIGDGAFESCNLPSAIIPNSVTRIGSLAFAYNDNLVGVIIPDSVTSIGDSAFAYCRSLASVDVDSGNPAYTSVDGVLFNKDKTVLHTYPAGKSDASYTIPDSITSITQTAFYGCTSLTSVIIPGSVTSITYGTFMDCSNLKSVIILNGVTKIDSEAFTFSGLTGITIPDSVTQIGIGAFRGCSNLTSIDVSSGNPAYTSVDGVLFNKDKTSLHTYPAGKSGAYTIPDSVTNIERNAFYSCCGLTDINVGFGNPAYASEDGVLFNKDITSLYTYPAGKSGAYTIPDGVTSIDRSAFCSSGLTSVIIPDSLTNILYAAFSNCRSLTDVYYAGSREDWAKISIDSENMLLTRAVIHYSGFWSSPSGTCGNNLTWVLENDTLRISGTGRMDSYKGTFAPWENEKSSITTIKIENGVTGIGWNAFHGCSNATSVIISGNIDSISNDAFYGCSSLTNITIPDSLIGIGDGAFYGCDNLTDVYYAGTEKEWAAIIGSNKAPLANATIHYNTNESDYTKGEIDKALENGNDLETVKDALAAINPDSLSKSLLESGVVGSITAAEGKVGVVVDNSANLGFAADSTTIAGAKVNFPDTADIRLVLGEPSDQVPDLETENQFGFSARLEDGSGKQLDAASLDVPVSITIALPTDKDIKPESVRVWHYDSEGTKSQIHYTSVDESGKYLTFVTSGFSDFVVTYDTYTPFSALLSGNAAIVRVTDERNTLKNCTTVYAARYEGGRMVELLSGTLSGNRITFSKPLTDDYVLFFLGEESAPVREQAALSAMD